MSLTESIQPLAPISGLKQVTDTQLRQFADLVYHRAGIRISPEKKTLLSNRVRRRLRATGISSFDAYYQHLRALPPEDPEWDAFLQEITTHETFLFRDEGQWQWFGKQYLPELASEARSGNRPKQLRIWSAACSTGDEPITIACCVAACLPHYSQWRVEILGTDIGVGALEEAREAVFGERAMRLVPADYRRRFFFKMPDTNLWKAKPLLTQMIEYRQHNLLEPIRHLPFDLVFLKNVLIYFDVESKRRVLANVRSAMRPGALLITGAAEGVAGLLDDFVRVHPWLHRRPAEATEKTASRTAVGTANRTPSGAKSSRKQGSQGN